MQRLRVIRLDGPPERCAICREILRVPVVLREHDGSHVVGPEGVNDSMSNVLALLPRKPFPRHQHIVHHDHEQARLRHSVGGDIAGGLNERRRASRFAACHLHFVERLHLLRLAVDLDDEVGRGEPANGLARAFVEHGDFYPHQIDGCAELERRSLRRRLWRRLVC